MCCAEKKAARAEKIAWFEYANGPPNATEMLFYALLLVDSWKSPTEEKEWAEKVLLEEKRYEEMGSSWTPPADPAWQPRGKRTAAIYEPLRNAYNRAGRSQPRWDEFGAAIQGWDGAGTYDGLRMQHLTAHFTKKLQGPPDARSRTQPRWYSSIFGVAALVKKRGAKLRAAIKAGAARKQPPSRWEQLQQAEAEKVRLKKQLDEARAEERRSKDAYRKAAARLLSKKKAVIDCRRKERAAASLKVKQAKAAAKAKFDERLKEAVERQVEQRVAEKQETFDRRLAKARARARRVESEARVSSSRLKRLRIAEAQLDERLSEMPEHASDSESEPEEPSAEAIRLASMPTWRPVRPKGRGRKSLEWSHRMPSPSRQRATRSISYVRSYRICG